MKDIPNMQRVRINLVWLRWCWSFTHRQPYQVMHRAPVWLGTDEFKLMFGEKHANLFPRSWQRTQKGII